MKIFKVLGVMNLMLCLFAISAQAQSVQSDFDRSFNLSKLKTFNFAIQKRSPNDPLAQDSLNNERIKDALESKLNISGFKLENDTKPDFAVAYYVTTKNKFNFTDYSAPRWFGRRDISVDQYTEGTLIVDIIDPTTKQLIWRGRASGAVELKDLDKKINKSVEKLVQQFVKDSKKRG